MLLDLFNWLAETNPDFSVFAYITLRGILGALTALAISLVLGPSFIRRLVKSRYVSRSGNWDRSRISQKPARRPWVAR